jgi:TonB family protein
VPARWLAVLVAFACLAMPPVRAAAILERGSGEGSVPGQASPSNSQDPLDGYEERFRAFAEKTDTTYGTDLRGRKASEDTRDLLAEYGAKFEASGADRKKLSAELESRVETLEAYWLSVVAVRSNRDIWPDFLAHNGLPPDTPHTGEVIAAEQALMTALRSGPPSKEWATLGNRLRDAYIEERHANTHWKPLSEADYHPRLSPCPAPAKETSGSQQAKTAKMNRAPSDFYPEASRKAFLEGSVILSVRISATGCADRLAIAGSSGSELLDEAAMRFGETMEFLPAEKEGKAVESTKQIRVTFKEIS